MPYFDLSDFKRHEKKKKEENLTRIHKTPAD